MKIILASRSPRRKELMDLAQIDYEILVSEFDEKVNTNLSLEEQSKEIAYGKAKDIFENTQGDRTIIGADTLVICNGKQFGKAHSREEAISMLKTLQGNEHSVYTSIAVLIEEKGEYKEYKEIYKAQVSVKSMTDEEIEEYVDCQQPYDFAGAYAIQTKFAVFIDRINGDYNTIIGLPIHRIYSILKENDII